MAEVFKTIPRVPLNVPVVEIADELCARAGLNLSWAGERKFGVHAYDHLHSSGADRKSKHAGSDDKVFHVRTTTVLFHPVARKLLAESNQLFLCGQKSAKEPITVESAVGVLKLSRGYRTLIRLCLAGFQSAAEASSAGERDSIIQYIPTFYNMELVWHLCEILFLDALPGHLVLTQLISWIQFHVPHVEKEALKLLSMEPGEAEKQENYWLVIVDCLLQRRIEIARSLLSVHPRAKSEPFQRMDQVLRTMPIFEVHGGLSATEFQVRHECWRKEATRLQRTGHFSNDQHLDTVAKIIIGDETAKEVIRRHSQTWYEHLVATLIYTAPAVKVFDLAFHANRSLNLYCTADRTSCINGILCAILEMDFFKMVDCAYSWPESDWLVTHLVHLMYISGKLVVPSSPDVGSQLLEDTLLSYGSLLMSHSALWQLGVDYITACPNGGQAHLEALLSRIPFSTNLQALKISRVAAEHNLPEVEYTIAKVQGLRAKRAGNLGIALTWAMKSQDPVFCSQLADEFLRDYVSSGQFKNLDLLESLGCEMMLGDRLVFLGKYCEFLRLKSSGELKEAGALLVLLLKNKVAPKYFLMTMFKDTMYLLEGKQPVFASADIMDLMLSFQELVDCTKDLDLPESQVHSIRTALTKNLATTLISDCGAPNPITLAF